MLAIRLPSADSHSRACLQQPPGLAQVLEDVGADDRVERAGRNLQVELLDIARPDWSSRCRAAAAAFASNSMPETLASCRCLIASPSRPAPQPMSSTRRAVSGTSANHLGPGMPEVERVGTCFGVAVGACGETCGPGCGLVGRRAPNRGLGCAGSLRSRAAWSETSVDPT